MLSDCRLVRVLKDSGKSWRQVHIVVAPPHCPHEFFQKSPRAGLTAAHRDSHFAPLGGLAPGQVITLRRADGVRHRFRITEGRIMHARTVRPNVWSRPARLALVTCWPLDSPVPGGPLRIAFFAELINTSYQHHYTTIATGLRQHSRTQNRHNWIFEPSSFQNKIRLKCILRNRAKEEKADEDLSLFGAACPI